MTSMILIFNYILVIFFVLSILDIIEVIGKIIYYYRNNEKFVGNENWKLFLYLSTAYIITFLILGIH